jgi:hypothetical protein
MKLEPLIISIVPIGFLIETNIAGIRVPVAACNNLTEDEAYKLADYLSKIGGILAKGNVQIMIEETIADSFF